MPTVVPEGYGQVIHSMLVTGDVEPMAVTIGMALNGVGSLPEITEQLHDAFGDFLVPQLPADMSLVQTEIHFNGAGGTGLEIFTHTLTRTGARPGGSLPNNCAFLVHKRTALAGRRGRGRFYIPGPEDGNVAGNGILSTALFDQVQAALNTWFARWGAPSTPLADVRPVVLHSHKKLEPPPTQPPTIITAFQLDTKIATQRRRLR